MRNVRMLGVVVFQNISILKKMQMLCLRISDFCLGTERMETLRRKKTLIPPMHYLIKS